MNFIIILHENIFETLLTFSVLLQATNSILSKHTNSKWRIRICWHSVDSKQTVSEV